MRGSIGSRECRPTFRDNCKHCHLVTMQDCYNQRKKVLKFTERRHENDLTSVDIIVQELQQEKYNPVILYKLQGSSSDEYPSCHNHHLPFEFNLNFRGTCFKLTLRQLSASILLIQRMPMILS